MKVQKIKMAVAIVTVCFSQHILMAQEKTSIPSKNDLAVELNFKPFGENIISFNQLQFKYRVADNIALRLGLALNSNKLNLKGDDYPDTDPLKYTGSENVTMFGVLPGVEFHFLKNSKISPYIGAELSFTKNSVKSHYRDFNSESYYNNVTGNYDTRYIPVEIDIKGATRTIEEEYYQTYYGYSYYYTPSYLNRAYTSYGGHLLLGCDYYFMRNLYVGLEAGLGYDYTKYQKVTIGYSNSVTPDIVPSYTDSKLGFYYNSALRLGFWF